ncbi:MAG: ATP-binding cassette domain-containing protein [Bacteroidales bacterium]|nr:ATP-binding cassette domain-containing protein [Bacteroidales bacterium]
MALLEVKNVSKRYTNHLALDNVSLSIDEGTIFGLLGPNGAGKTTLIRIINNITLPDSGEVLLNGKRLTFDDTAHIGYLPEERGLYKKMKVGEEALYLAQLKGMSRHDAISELKSWFERFEIESWWNKKVSDLSKGMAQKVQFITTVAHRPKLLIFDEPFSGFDPLNAFQMKQEILRLKNEGATIIFSTHNMSSVEELCNKIALINHSKVVLEGEVNAIRKAHRDNIYNIELENYNQQPFSSVDILNKTEYNDVTQLRVKLRDGFNTNNLISEIITSGTLIHYTLETPSMDEIFIKTVE